MWASLFGYGSASKGEYSLQFARELAGPSRELPLEDHGEPQHRDLAGRLVLKFVPGTVASKPQQ